MKYEIRQQRLVGSNHILYSLYVDGELAHEQIQPYSESEIEARIAAHVRPAQAAPVAKKVQAFASSIKGGNNSVNARAREKDWNRDGGESDGQ